MPPRMAGASDKAPCPSRPDLGRRRGRGLRALSRSPCPRPRVRHTGRRGGNLLSAAVPGGTDAVDLANWLLRFGRESEALREEMAAWTNWLANTAPPWAAYWAMMTNRLVALDKQLGTRPVGIGEVYRRLWAKCLLKAIGSQATAACGNFNLCTGLQAGIEGAVHAVRDVFANPSLIPDPPADPLDPTDPLTQAPDTPPATPAATAPAPPSRTSPTT